MERLEPTAAIALAREVHTAWDRAWPEIQRNITGRGLEIVCEESCHGCCFDLKTCAQSEGMLITEFLRTNFLPDRQEHFRSRVECAAGNLRRLRADANFDGGNGLLQSGGLECPFLDRGRCAVYQARPLACRSMVVAAPDRTKANTSICRQCAESVVCRDALAQRIALEARLFEFGPTPRRNSVAETLSDLWETTSRQPATDTITVKSWKTRRESRDGWFDQTWRDDGHDWQIVKRAVVLPAEGEHPPDLVVLQLSPSGHDVYGEQISTNEPIELRVLYKLLPGGRFDWSKRVFETERNADSHIVWMGDSIQERLMMWEAAKRCRGRVLCGGLGMGIFPQFALSLPRVESMVVVEMDEAIISLIGRTWCLQAWPQRDRCSIRHSSIETFLRTTKEKFDTVYIDTWDALTYDYLPHINYLKRLARRTLRPGGEVLLWGYDMMVRFALQQAKFILSAPDYFLAADAQQLKTLRQRQPLFHEILRWYLRHPACSEAEFYDETYRLATSWEKDLGRLSLDRIGDRV